MKYAFVCYGGSGSTFLQKRLQRGWRCHSRPETYWLPEYFPRRLKKKRDAGYVQTLDSRGYDNYPSAGSVDGFFARTQFRISADRTIIESLIDYYLWQRENPNVAVMFSRAPMHGFFRRIRDLTRPGEIAFVVRHPLRQYLSLTAPGRHPEFVEGFGGVDTEGGVLFFAEEWNRFTSDALESGAQIIRYECAAEDLSRLDPVPAKVFSGWSASRRNSNPLSRANSRLFRDRVAVNYGRIYGGLPWED